MHPAGGKKGLKDSARMEIFLIFEKINYLQNSVYDEKITSDGFGHVYFNC
jgi:hypothetical protein